MNGPTRDTDPPFRRAGAPPAARELLAQAQHTLDEAAVTGTDNERFATAHLAALRTAAAVLAVRGRPDPPARRGRRRIRSAWEVLPQVAPELAEWSALFAAGAPRRERAEAGIAGAVTRREADDLLRASEAFVRLAEQLLVARPAPPQSRPSSPPRTSAVIPEGAETAERRRPRAG